MNRKRLFQGAAFFAVFWAFMIIAGRYKLLRDPGTFWHVVVGREILASGTLPDTDVFSFTFYGKPWIAQQWLGEIAMAWLDAIGGFDALVLATSLYIAAVFSWLGLRLFESGVHWLLVVLLVFLAFGAGSYQFHVRPFVVHLAFIGVTFALLCDWEAERIPLSRLFVLPPLFVIWTNIHGSVLGGIATLGAVGLGWTLFRTIGLSSPIRSFRDCLQFGLLIVLCSAATLVNPYGLEMHRAWFDLLGSSHLSSLIEEHRPLLQTGSRANGLLNFAGLYLVFLLGSIPARPRVTWLFPLVWLALAFGNSRHGPLFAVTAAIALADLFPHVRWVGWLGRRGWEVFRLRNATHPSPLPPSGRGGLGGCWLLPVAIACLLLATGLLFHHLEWPIPVLGKGWARLDHMRWPVPLLPELKKKEAESNGRRKIFNEMIYGGFLIYYTPGYQVFIDDRCELYGAEFLREVADTVRHNPAHVDGWLDAHDLDLALTQTGAPLDRYLRQKEGWQIIQETPAATLHFRKTLSKF